MEKEKKQKVSSEPTISQEWMYFLAFLFGLAMLYIYLTHRIDNIVRDIERTKKNLIELRAENITLKSEIMKNRSRENLEKRLESRGVKEPNRAAYLIKVKND
jgi:cell division protein FtsB